MTHRLAGNQSSFFLWNVDNPWNIRQLFWLIKFAITYFPQTVPHVWIQAWIRVWKILFFCPAGLVGVFLGKQNCKRLWYTLQLCQPPPSDAEFKLTFNHSADFYTRSGWLTTIMLFTAGYLLKQMRLSVLLWGNEGVNPNRAYGQHPSD